MRKFLQNLWRVITYPFRALWWLITLPVRAVRRGFKFLTFEPEDRPMMDAFTETIRQPGALIEHIDALRKHLLRMLIAVAIGAGICATFTSRIIDFLAQSIGGIQELQVIDPTESIGVFMRVALFGGFALALPYIAFELWLFAAPGLHARARRMGLLGIPMALIFFLGGVAFTYFIMLPAALPFLRNFMDVTNNWRLSTYMSFVTGLLFWIGVAFEFPLVIYVLTYMGIVRPRFLLQQWRIAVVVIAIVAAAVTPTVDPVNMAIVMTPMVLLYVVSIGLSQIAMIGRRRREEA